MAPSLFQVAVSLMFVGAAVSSSDNEYGQGGGLYKRIAAAMPHSRDAALTPAVVPASLPGSWTYQGCYTENGPRTLIGKATSSGTLMTDEFCIAFCDQNGYLYAGTEYSNECYCGNVIGSTSAVAPSSECSMGCSGNSTEACGGPGRLTVFWNGEDPPPGPSTNPGAAGYGFYGCYTEGEGGRALSHGYTVPGGDSKATVALCIATCNSAGYSYAGLEYYHECCQFLFPALTEFHISNRKKGVIIPSEMPPLLPLEVSLTATRFALEILPSIIEYLQAGLHWFAINGLFCGCFIYASSSSTSASPTPTPTVLRVVPSAGPFNYVGCYTEANNGRALTSGAFPADTLTVESCATSCASYDYFGVEYGRECYCGNKLAPSSTKAPETDCSFTCAGDALEYCGAGNRLNVYIKNGTVPPPSTTAPAGPGTIPTPPTTPPTQATGLPTGWQYDGCYTEGTTGRALTTLVFESGTNSVESCVNTCIAQGYTVAGMEYSSQCFCDNVLYNGAAPTDDSKCQMSCSGNAAEKCGGPGALSLYHTGALKAYAAPTAQKTGLPGSWVYQGCWSDNMDGRALFWQSILTTNNTATSCLNLCHDYGYMAAGLQYGDECMCGDHQKAIDAGSTQQPETDCQVPCSGDRTYYCGGGSRNSYYRWIGDDLYTWHKPTGPDAGSYEFLIGGVVVPLITTAGINKKVTFMEKSGTGAPNTTGSYELDLSLKNDFSKAWRPLHVKSDIFCSAGVTLPDKAGRQLNIGGWAGPSTYGVRFYWPDGSPGVAGTNDWQENVNEVSLKEGRWYPSAMNMANGSILILGGEIGSNSAPTPSCEILPPPPGGYAKYLDWLDRTDPDNLYPFMFVLPTGNIFVVYYNEARIIDEKTFDTIKTLPNMPGSVNNFLSGRTYPLEGTGVLLPMHAPFTAPVVVLICGGSANGAAYAVDNCVSTQPEDATPTWNLERMPSQRVMSCICALPDGTYLILNGAQEGVAGFGLAQDPNYNAILYDPSKPLNQRMFIMASTIVARLYHSEAMLLPDGRVLVSGSNPEDGVHPEEYRVEVFNPPYILNNLPKPSYTITTTNKDWSYGSTRQITANIPSGNLAGVRISMMAAVSSTHGNSMGQRTLFLQVGCAGAANAATCTITTPPTAHVAPPGWYMIFVLDGPTPSEAEWVRIGGDVADAAGIGNWPAAADFKTPGLGPIGS
ncbi:hypothetical protein HYFRA_00013045 [Hymenoscyphus fraxineus]|uniref:WSC domain-containing protein n=1 Tax=Hymenoscyphus fraxineus TaxID=746836 RepID=A0A9N9L3I5_9HELO|nr:hypothetical protein HYFRA_00013045 [Hymenoscyphus fraxineus]